MASSHQPPNQPPIQSQTQSNKHPLSPNTLAQIKLVDDYSAHNYKPLEVVISRAEGPYVWDVDGKQYFDCLSAYSSLNQGHRHPEIIQALKDQADRVTLTSRAFHNDKMGAFLKLLCEVTQSELALPMNTGAEAVETAIKAARLWGYTIKKIPDLQAEIIVASENFHGRTTTIVSFSDEPSYRDHFGPYTPGFKISTYGDAKTVESLITPNTVAILVEPIQGESGVQIPDPSYLSDLQKLCKKNNMLLIADEIQSGLGRTAQWFGYQNSPGVKPDLVILGKALGGGVYPVSAVVGRKDVLGLFYPGQHGSTFGGNPLGSAVGLASLQVLRNGVIDNAAKMAPYFRNEIEKVTQQSSHVNATRIIGLWAGIDIKPSSGSARKFCEKLLDLGLLAKDTRAETIRLAPPLIIGTKEIDFIVDCLRKVLL